MPSVTLLLMSLSFIPFSNAVSLIACYKTNKENCKRGNINDFQCINLENGNPYMCLTLWENFDCVSKSIKKNNTQIPTLFHHLMPRARSVSTCNFGMLPKTAKKIIRCQSRSFVSSIYQNADRSRIEIECYNPIREVVVSSSNVGKKLKLSGNILSSSQDGFRGVGVLWDVNDAMSVFGYRTPGHQNNFPQGSLCGHPNSRVCGMHFELYNGGAAVNAAGPLCCLQPSLGESCSPQEKFEEIHRCDNRHGETQLTCEYSKTTGLSSLATSSWGKEKLASGSLEQGFQMGSRTAAEETRSSNVGVSLPLLPQAFNFDVSTSLTETFSRDLQNNFAKTIGSSEATGYNWDSQSTDGWTEEKLSKFFTETQPGVETRFYQLRGTCGPFVIKTNVIKRIDFDVDGSKFQTDLRFNMTPISSSTEGKNRPDFNIPKVQGILSSNALPVSGSGKMKEVAEVLPQILGQMGAESKEDVKRFSYTGQQRSAEIVVGVGAGGVGDSDEDVPDFVSNFDEGSKGEVKTDADGGQGATEEESSKEGKKEE